MNTPPSAGWQPDPTGRHQYRYYNGSTWTVQVSDNGQQATDAVGLPELNAGATPFAAPPAPKKPVYQRVWFWVAAVLVLMIVIGATSGGKKDDGDKQASNDAPAAVDAKGSDAGKADAGKAEDTSDAKPDGCGTRATDDCTPEVGPDGKVRVDALTYRLMSAKSAATIGDTDYLGEKANGVYVILDVKVTSQKTESATLTDNVFKLEVDGKTYDPDTSGTVAAVGDGQEPFFLEDIGPDATIRGKVVFDVPKKVLRESPKLRIGELGFGSTHAYIRLPDLG
jgi:hypothetical protein